jgi:hypothetical protein
VRTLVVSDLHLGSRTGVDVLRRPEALGALCERLDGVERLVLLGDTLELRHGPAHRALEDAAPALRAIGRALGDAEVVLVPGNHDHPLAAPWLDARAQDGPAPPLGLEERAGPGASAATLRVAELLAPASLDVAYPGVWLRDDVYATHGHYLDRHATVPSFERLAAGALGRFLRMAPHDMASPDDYERVLAPLYALLDAIAARTGDGHGVAGPAGASARAWELLSGNGGRPPWRGRLLAGAFPAGIAALNRAGLGPLRADLSGEELRRAGLRAMGDVVRHLGIGARHVVFGHTHRAGPLPGDDEREWTLAGGARLLNAGCWVFEEMYVGRRWGRGPYWPGGAIALDAASGPEHLRVLDALPASALKG